MPKLNAKRPDSAHSGIADPLFRQSRNRNYNLNADKGAAALIAVVLVLFGSLALVSAFSSMTLNEIKVSRNQTKSLQTYYAAEGGVEDLIYRVKKLKNYNATENFSLNGVNVSVGISGGAEKIITAQGDLNNLFRSVASKIKITTQSFEFHYGVQVGAGGLVLAQNAGVAGNIYSNGPVSGENGSFINGDAFVAATSSTLSDSYTVQTADQNVGQSSSAQDVAQSFKASFTGQIGQISLYLKKIGSPGDKTVRIMSDSGGNPNKNNVLAFGTLSSSLVTGSYGWINITFTSPANVNNNTTYWIMIDSSADASKYYIWGKDSNYGFGNGVAKYSADWNAGNPTWTAITGDLNFKIWQGGINSISGIAVYGDARANTITNSKVCGNAYYQTIDPTSLTFVNRPGSPCPTTPYTNGFANPPDGISPPDLGPQNMPISEANIQDWVEEAQTGGTIEGDLSITTDQSLGPKEINGNLLLTSNNKILTVSGTIYVHGNIDVSGNGSTIRCDASFGIYSCIIVAEGWIHIPNNGNFSGSGQAGSFIMLLSTLACDGTSAAAPDGRPCGDDNSAIDIHNNAIGAIFYASSGLLKLYNGVNITEATAYKLTTGNNAVITYQQGLANARFSSGPGASYEISEWKETE